MNKREKVKMDTEERGYGKIVDDLTIDDFKKYEDAGISILLVKSQLSSEVLEAVGKSKVHVYADLDPKTINIVRELIAAAGGNSNEKESDQ